MILSAAVVTGNYDTVKPRQIGMSKVKRQRNSFLKHLKLLNIYLAMSYTVFWVAGEELFCSIFRVASELFWLD